MRNGLTAASSATLGAALMYFFDPHKGHRRRMLLRDQATHLVNQSYDVLDAGARDLQHRAYGWLAETQSLLSATQVPDEVLVQRVRATMGRYVSHPHAIEVTASDGIVTLKGPILSREADHLLRALRRMRAISGIVDRLERHERPEDIPSLQGGVPRPDIRPELAEPNWPPSIRVFAVASGAGLVVYGASRRGLTKALATCVGLLLAARGITNMDVRRLTGIGADRRAIDVQKTITINMPVERVFDLWSHYERFPHIMAHVLAVLKSPDEHSRWIVLGPLDIPVGWDATITKRDENQLLAWKTLPGSLVQHSGIVRFERIGDGSTRVDVRMSYNPVVGAIGHLVAKIFAVDPKSAMDEDFVRFKSLLEYGKTSAHGTEVTLAQVAG